MRNKGYSFARDDSADLWITILDANDNFASAELKLAA
jgi:hypothetical protein